MERMSFSPQSPCRCGYKGEGEHPCHRCINKGGEVRPGKAILVAYPTSLAGMQMKLGAYESYACDPCREEFDALVKAEKAKVARER